MTKFAAPRPCADPDAAARQLVQLAAGIESVQDGRIHIEKINAPFLYTLEAAAPRLAPASGMPSSTAG
ncbi:protein of unknown function [Bradyrhizobium vignae]|uniref:Uncharacterized protein n=1 Tax=Bradyrhizobium vignae TaxID=1549949 RepID=A0A2U3PVN4_9BRAD|nr:protein of unknown function [Bradyrhizobium vignae]